jgi:hypothetical protein
MGDDGQNDYHDYFTANFLISQQYGIKQKGQAGAICPFRSQGNLPADQSPALDVPGFFAEHAVKLAREACAELDAAGVIYEGSCKRR